MKVRIYSQWMEDVYVPVRVKQFTKAARLMGKSSFAAHVDVTGMAKSSERQAVADWLEYQDRAVVTAAGIA